MAMKKKLLIKLDEYIDNINSSKYKKRYKGYEEYLNASSAGMCFKKHQYKKNKEEGIKPDTTSKIRMRLGDIIHSDIQNAIRGIFNGDTICLDEVELKDNYLKVRGFSDIILMNLKNRNLEVYDIKSIGKYPYSKKFGIKKNRDTAPSIQYELQLGTYAMMAERKFKTKVEEMGIIYYRQDDAFIKYHPVDLKFKTAALEYWKDVNIAIKKELIPGESLNVPIYIWECRYCPFREKCNTPYGDK